VAPADDELRLITALFADITGSTGLGERLAPDEVKAVIGECVTRMSRAVEEFGGIVQAYQGDGICAYFGVPLAHEDDPERAVRAGLRIVDLVGAYAREAEAAWGVTGLNVRVGVNSGRAAVGTVGAADPQTVALGDATNVAARLESHAEPGTVLVGDATARRLRGRFVVEPRGELAVKGRQESVTAWRVAGVHAPSDQDTTRATPTVGRERELAVLGGALDALAAGRGQIVMLVGDAGIGTTRLLAEARRAGRGRITWLEGHAHGYGGQAPFGPLVDVLRAWLEVGPAEPPLALRTRLRTRLTGPALELLPELARLLSVPPVPGSEPDPLAELPAAAVGERLRAAYVSWLDWLAGSGPVAVALEDVHWADPSSAELAAEVMALADRAPVGLFMTLRPEPGTSGWSLRTQALADFAHRLTSIEVGPLSRDAAEELAAALAPAGGLDPATRRTLAEVSEGNPLFLEELMARLRETGGLAHHQAWTLTVPRNVLPPGLEGLLVARIDHLAPEVRRVAEAAAVVGRVFPRPVLNAVLPDTPGPVLDAALASLIRSGIVVERGRYPELSYEFRHGLLHEAALSTLTDARRAEFHRAAADAYESVYADGLDAHLEELAHHLARAHDLGRALVYLERGAERAAGLGAADEASRLWLRALRTANRLDDTEAAERIRARMGAGDEAG